MASNRPWLMIATRRQMRVTSWKDVGAEQYRMILPERTDHFAGFLDLSWIQAGSGFIEQQHFGFAEQCLRQPDALAIALGQLVDFTPEHALQAACRGHAFDLRSALRLARNAFDARDEAQVLRDIEGVVNRGGCSGM